MTTKTVLMGILVALMATCAVWAGNGAVCVGYANYRPQNEPVQHKNKNAKSEGQMVADFMASAKVNTNDTNVVSTYYTTNRVRHVYYTTNVEKHVVYQK